MHMKRLAVQASAALPHRSLQVMLLTAKRSDISSLLY